MKRLADYLQSKRSPYVPIIVLAITLSPLFLCLAATVVLLILDSRDSISFIGIVCLLGALTLFVAIFPASIILVRILTRGYPPPSPPDETESET